MNKAALLSFVCGAIVGAVCVHIIEKERHEKEIESVKETYRANAGKKVIHMPEKDNVYENDQNPDTEKKEKEPIKKNEFQEYQDLTRRYNGSSQKKDIYPIPPDEFGDLANYDRITYYYYNDGVVADEDGDRIIDLEEKIGDGLDYLGEYEPDSSYVRNDILEIDYEILAVDEKYTDYLERMGGRS